MATVAESNLRVGRSLVSLSSDQIITERILVKASEKTSLGTGCVGFVACPNLISSSVGAVVVAPVITVPLWGVIAIVIDTFSGLGCGCVGVRGGNLSALGVDVGKGGFGFGCPSKRSHLRLRSCMSYVGLEKEGRKVGRTGVPRSTADARCSGRGHGRLEMNVGRKRVVV